MPPKHETGAVHAVVQGRVQGVGFRYFVVEQAQRLDLRGWVRNLERGDVEVYAEGARADLEELIRQLERGPGMAYVSSVTVEWQSPTGSFTRFSVAPGNW